MAGRVEMSNTSQLCLLSRCPISNAFGSACLYLTISRRHFRDFLRLTPASASNRTLTQQLPRPNVRPMLIRVHRRRSEHIFPRFINFDQTLNVRSRLSGCAEVTHRLRSCSCESLLR